MSDRYEKVLQPFRTQASMMEERIASGIEQHRKAYATLRFVDRDGTPLTDVHVQAEQVTHDFQFGCSIFLLDELETAEKNRQYEEAFRNTFNLAVAPFYWGDLEPTQGKPRYAVDSPKVYRRPSPDLVVNFCKQHDIGVKGHCIVYDAFSPKWLPREVPAIKHAYETHMAELAARYGQDIPAWDVINETLCWNVYDGGLVTPFFRENDYVDWSFDCAKRHFPTQRLFINEATDFCWGNGFRFNRTPYSMQIETLLARGVPIGGIGMQAHSFVRREQEAEHAATFYDPLRIYDIMDHYARFGKPLHVSEVTIPSYNGDTMDEEVQAEVLRNLWRMWFSHPAMEAIVYWNLVDGYTFVRDGSDWNENYYGGGLLRHDMTPKPAFRVLDELIHQTWHTQVALDTGAQSQTTFKGFLGKYHLTIHHGDHETHTTIHLDKRSDLIHTILCD